MNAGLDARLDRLHHDVASLAPDPAAKHDADQRQAGGLSDLETQQLEALVSSSRSVVLLAMRAENTLAS